MLVRICIFSDNVGSTHTHTHPRDIKKKPAAAINSYFAKLYMDIVTCLLQTYDKQSNY